LTEQDNLKLNLKNIFTTMVDNYISENNSENNDTTKKKKKNEDGKRKTINLFKYESIELDKTIDNDDVINDIFLLLDIIKKEKGL